MNSVTCPKCNSDFSLDAVMKTKATAMIEAEQNKVTAEIEKQRKLLNKQKKDIDDAKADLETSIAARLADEKIKLTKELQKNLTTSWETKVSFLELQVRESEERAKKAVESEISFRAREADVAKKERELSLTLEAQVEERSNFLRDEISKNVADEYRKRDQEKDLQLSELRNQIVVWKQKAEQGSQQIQGEALELELETALRSAFPGDSIEPVPKGVNGADLIQDVLGNAGQRYGRIIWETKRTKNFSGSWIPKLKADRNAAKADVAILVTEALPPDHGSISETDGVWVIKPDLALGIAIVLRSALKEVNTALAISSGRTEKAEIVFNYLTSPTFRQRLETVVESFTSMRDDLEKEKRVTQRSWKLRENQLESIFQSALGMYSDIQLVLGAQTFQIPALEYGSAENHE